MVIDVLIEKIKETGNPTVVGLDPRLDFVPDRIKEEAADAYGHTLQGAAEAFYLFNKAILDEIHDLVPAVKPQIALYEQYGAAGIDSYIRTVEYAKEKGLLVIGDVKRGDIASTAEAYSDGHIGRVSVDLSPSNSQKPPDLEEPLVEVYKEDFITLNPYLGGDSIEPYLKNCKAYGKGLFILVKTSNPKSGDLQDLVVDGETIYEKTGFLVEGWGQELIGAHGYSSVGAVVGATYPEQGSVLRRRMPHVFFLVPGYGAQGGRGDDVAPYFDRDGLGAIINSSRGIIAAYRSSAYKKDFTEAEFAKASRQAVLDMRKDLRR